MEGALCGLPHQASQLPSPPGEESAPPGPGTRLIHRFPGSSHVPGVSSGWCPFPTVKAFLRLTPAAAQGVEANNCELFSFSTAKRRLSAIECSYTLLCSQVVHTLSTDRPRTGRPARMVAHATRAGRSFFAQLLHE